MKKVFAKVYKNDLFLKEWDEITFNGFYKIINSGLSDCVLTLAEPFDYNDEELKLGNRIDIYVIDDDTDDFKDGSKKIYSGFISSYEPINDGKNNYVSIRLMPYNTYLALDVAKKEKTTILYTSEDEGLVKGSFGDSTTQFDITNPSGTTFRYTWDGTGTDPIINSDTIPVGNTLYIYSANFNAGNNGEFVTTAVSDDYFEITNASGVAENNKTLGDDGQISMLPSSTDLSVLFKAVIEVFNENNDFQFNYINSEDTGVDVNLSFTQRTYKEILDNIIENCPEDWFYYIDENNTVVFKEKNTYTKHIFDFSKHIGAFHIYKNIDNVKNVILLWNGVITTGTLGIEPIYKAYENTDSIEKYGRRVLTHLDTGVWDEDTADILGNALLNKNCNEEIKIECDILDDNFDPINGYDIESIQPGDTCSFRGLDKYSDLVKVNAMIDKIYYTPEKVTITLQIQENSIFNIQKNMNKSIKTLERENMPSTYE